MSETVDQAQLRFVFEISEDENQAFRKLAARDLKRYIDRRIVKGIPLLVFLCAYGALVVAMLRNAVSLATVLTGAASVIIGYYSAVIAGLVITPRIYRALFRDSPNASKQFDCAFGEEDIAVKVGEAATRMPWRSIARVEHTQSLVAFWYRPTQGFFVPRRMFSDDAAYTRFASWAASRAQASASNPAATASIIP